MMRNRFSAGALLVLAAMGAAPAAAGGKAPAANDGYDWTMRVDDEERAQSAVLAYEVADTDDQPLAFACEEGGNRIFASITGGDPELSAIELTSGDARLHLMGTTDAEELPYFSSEEIAGGSPLIRAFAANGWLRLTASGETTDMAATAKGRDAIARFVRFCTE
jgi:hypothetical protein